MQEHIPVAERLAGPGHSAGRSRSGLSTEVGRSEPPPGSPAPCFHAEWDSQRQEGSL